MKALALAAVVLAGAATGSAETAPAPATWTGCSFDFHRDPCRSQYPTVAVTHMSFSWYGVWPDEDNGVTVNPPCVITSTTDWGRRK